MSMPMLAKSLVLISALGLHAGAGLTVHEWGTFTTLSSSSGLNLSGLYLEASRLPGFVHGLPFFNYDSARGWPDRKQLRNVTVKMETPVLYFYSPVETEISAKVGFQGGTISQWYPQRQSGEANPAGPVVDLGAAPYQGSVAWKAKVLAPKDVPAYTTPLSQETPEWVAPRATQANLLRGQGGEIEKFLFYRGLGRFSTALDIRFDKEGRLVLSNHGDLELGYIMIYESAPGAIGGAATIWWQGALAKGGQMKLTRPKDPPDYGAGQAAMENFKQEMIKAGLYEDEAKALLNTWYNGYFLETGLKAFWILPRAQVDHILPLQIAPVPEKLERVIVGRSDILTPEFEKFLQAAQAAGTIATYAKDKYYFAYLDFLEACRDGRITSPSVSALPVSPRARDRGSVVEFGVRGMPLLRIPKGNSGATVSEDIRGRLVPGLSKQAD